MTVTSSRVTQVSFSGDITENIIQSAADNTTSIAKTDNVTLSSGANTITAPVITGLTVSALTIIPPAGNTSLITLKGISGDTGVAIHKTDPTSIALDSTFVSLVLNAAAQINGVRLIWS
jgi:hypothetical protein